VLLVREPVRMRAAILGVVLALLPTPVLRAQTPALAGIAHVAFRVANLDQSRSFYHKLGFEQFLEFSSAGKTSVAYMKINDRQFIELYARTEDSQPLGLMHVCYESTELAAVHDVYATRGLTPTDVKKAHAGNLLFVIHDPEGQLLEYTQYEPGSLHSLDRGKHLGPDRISQRLIGATLPVLDTAAERAFYMQKLGFESTADNPALRLPGTSGDEIELVPHAAAATPGITFQVVSAKRTAKLLRHRGLSVRTTHDRASIQDPDGNLIIFQKLGAKALR
jgi:catechol 2,3-dioxygenase-like lactoylglutathione lyase family enzyme